MTKLLKECEVNIRTEMPDEVVVMKVALHSVQSNSDICSQYHNKV